MRGRSGSYQLYQARWKNTATDEICLRRSFLIEAMLENLGTPLWQVTMKSSFWLRGFYRQQDPDLCGVCRCPKNFPRMARLEVSGWNDSGLVQQLKHPKKIAFLKQSFFGGMWRLWRSRFYEHGHSDDFRCTIRIIPFQSGSFQAHDFWMNCNNLTVMSLEWWFMSEIIFKRLYFRSGNYHNLPSQWLARLWKLTSGWSQQAAFPKRNMCYSFSPLTLWVFTLAILYELDFGQSIWDLPPKTWVHMRFIIWYELGFRVTEVKSSIWDYFRFLEYWEQRLD